MSARKLTTGITRLDDLLMGGIPERNNVLIYGPMFVGKEWLITKFIAKGLEESQPGIVLLTNMSAGDFRDELMEIVPELEKMEQKELIYYIDAYTRILGEDAIYPNTYFIDSMTNIADIVRDLDEALRTIKEKHPGAFRFGLISLSTLIVNISFQAAFRLAYVIAGRVKRSGGVGLYSLDQGMHRENEVNTFAHLMDGIIEFKEEFEPNHKTYLRVLGLGNVKTRNWVEYEFDGKELRITGSFTLGRIV